MRQILDIDRDAIFVLQTVRQNFKLQLPHHADHIPLIGGVRLLEDLDGAFLPQLGDPLDEMLAFQGGLRLHFREPFRRKHRKILECDIQSRFADRVADGEDAGIEQADDISRIRFLHDRAFLRHELLRLRQRQRPARLLVPHGHPPREFAGTNPHERQTVAVRRIHVSLNFKHERAEAFILRPDQPLLGQSGRRRRRQT